MKRIIFIVIILLLTRQELSLAQGETFLLNWSNIIEEAKATAPTIEKIHANFLNAKLNKNQYLENFSPELEANISRFKTNEDPFIPFVPTVSPISNYSLGVSKNFSSGMKISLSNKTRKEDYGAFGVDARNSISLEFTMDLYKNFFGRDSKSRLSYFDFEEKIAGIQKQIDEEIFLINLRRIYTSLILNEEAIKISNQILTTYQKQEADAKNRYQNGITDLSEVKRRSAQVAAKRIDILNLNSQKENLILSLKELLPSMADKNVVLQKYNLSKQEEYFGKIIVDIESKTQAPLNYTSYDEIVALIEKSYQQQKRFTKNYSRVDVELYSSFDHFGRDKNIPGAIDNNYNLPEDAYEVGLRIKTPIGSTKSNSRDLQLSIAAANFLAKQRENLGKVKSYHSQALKNLQLLTQAQKIQKDNSKNLENILKLSQTKYHQARITVKDLIEDQNFYLESLLSEIEIKRVIFNQILDYMMVFTSTPFSLQTADNG